MFFPILKSVCAYYHFNLIYCVFKVKLILFKEATKIAKRMSRPDWDETFMEICEVLAKRSTCLRLQTASVIVKNHIIVSIGYNGVVSGQEHCCDYWKRNQEDKSLEEFLKTNAFSALHHNWSIVNELHGEMNAILFAGKHGISLEGSTLYSIYSPCINCAKSILTSGITDVYYKHLYKRDTSGIEFLTARGVVVHQSSLGK